MTPIQFHDHIGVIKADAHSIRATTEKGACETFRVILESWAIVGNDDRRAFCIVLLDVDVNFSSGFDLFVRPAHLQPVEGIVEKIVQCT